MPLCIFNDKGNNDGRNFIKTYKLSSPIATNHNNKIPYFFIHLDSKIPLNYVLNTLATWGGLTLCVRGALAPTIFFLLKFIYILVLE